MWQWVGQRWWLASMHGPHPNYARLLNWKFPTQNSKGFTDLTQNATLPGRVQVVLAVNKLVGSCQVYGLDNN